MNSLHDARAWEIVRQLAEANPGRPVHIEHLRREAQELTAQASELEEAKRMIAHLQSIRLGLLEACETMQAAVCRIGGTQGKFEILCPDKTLAKLDEVIKAARAGKIPPQVHTVKILGETPIEREAP